MKKMIGMAFLWTGLAIACGGGSGGGGSGVDGDKKLVDLSADDISAMCNYFSDLAGPERTVDCGNGTTVTVGGGDVAECIAGFTDNQSEFPNCTATVDNAEGCFEGFAAFSDEELCSENTQLPAACAPLFSADCGGV